MKIWFLTFFVLTSFALQADVYLGPGESVWVGQERVFCSPGNTSPGRFFSEVELNCLRLKRQNYHYTPQTRELLDWAKECRTLVAPSCRLIQTKPGTECVRLLTSWMSYRPTDREMSSLEQSCVIKEYRCE